MVVGLDTALPVVVRSRSSPAAAAVHIEAEAVGHSNRLVGDMAVDRPSLRIRGLGIAAAGLALAWGESVMPRAGSARDVGRENARICWPRPSTDLGLTTGGVDRFQGTRVLSERTKSSKLDG